VGRGESESAPRRPFAVSAQRRKGSPWRIVPQKPLVFQPRIVREATRRVRTPGGCKPWFERVASQQKGRGGSSGRENTNAHPGNDPRKKPAGSTAG